MSAQLLEGLSVAGQLLMQLAARHEYAPLYYASVPPLDDEQALAAAEEVQERGLLRPSADSPALMLLTPVGYSLRDTIIARWDTLHDELRPRLLAHLRRVHGIEGDSPIMAAFSVVDRAGFLPEASRPLADLDLPAPIGISEMTTSAPHAIVAILRSVMPTTGERVLVCGAKGGLTIALSAHMVGPTGEVVGIDDDPAVAEYAAAALLTVDPSSGRARVQHVPDVTVGLPDEAPFHVVIMNGSVPKIPVDLVAQLAEPQGRLLLFLQEASTDGQTCYVLSRDGPARRDEVLSRFVFTPIFGRWGWDRVSNPQPPR